MTMATGKTAESVMPLAAEWATFRRQLPRLLERGDEGRFALIQGDTLIGVYDTFDAAEEEGYNRFGPEAQFMAQPIDPQFLLFPESPPPSLPPERFGRPAAS
jgi:hypothetical protein